MARHRFLKTLTGFAVLAFTAALLISTVSDALGKNAPKLESSQKKKTRQISRLELQNDLMRFAQVLIRGFRASFLPLADENDKPAVRFALSEAELRGVTSVLTIVTGPDAVSNLLDLVVYVTMGRLYVEKNWNAGRYGKNRGELPAFLRQMEKEIWTIAGKVLIPRYQEELRDLIDRWQKDHPGQFFVEGIGFDSLADMLGDSEFKHAAKSGFFLPEVNEATRSLDETRNLIERLVFFANHLPYILHTTVATGLYDFLDQPETLRLLADIDRLSTAIESIGVSAKNLPDRLSQEREKLLNDLLASEGRLRALSSDVRKTLAAGGKAATAVNQAILSADQLVKRVQGSGAPGSFDIQDYITIVNQATEAAKQAQTLVAMVDKLSTGPGLPQRLSHLKQGVDALLLRAFLWAALLIVFFFGVLFAYRYLVQRFSMKEG